MAWLPNGGSDPTSTDLSLQLLASSRKDNTIVVEDANGFTNTYTVTAGATTVITITPQQVYWDPSSAEEEIVLSKGLRVYSSDDEVFTLYSTNQIGAPGSYSYDGAHILPVEALGTEYIVHTAEGDFTATEFVVMSTMPGVTNVTMNLKVESRRQNMQQLNVTFSGPKQIYIVRSRAHNPEDQFDFIDLSGSSICADQPVAVWSGNQVAIIPNQDGMGNDHAYDQLLPLNKWGKEFIVPMTACKTKQNLFRAVTMQDNTHIVIRRNGTVLEDTIIQHATEHYSRMMLQPEISPNPERMAYYVTADKPIQVYLYASSGGANSWVDYELEKTFTPSDPSMTIIPPLDYLTDTTIFSMYEAGDGTLVHQVNIWALSSQISNIQMKDASGTVHPITDWRTVPSNTSYAQSTFDVPPGTYTVTAPTKCFSGYAYGISDGQAYMYPIGYDFTPKEDSLFVIDNDSVWTIRESEWKADYVSPTEGGWHLDKILLDNGEYLLDSIFICDSTILTFPIKTYLPWFKVLWEIEGSIQGSGYFTPEEQMADNVARPELEHQFHLLPIEQNAEPFEDFELRGILFRKPILCEDIPEEYWQKDTFNTVVRVLRQYNDTTWRAICIGDTVQFFKDTIWNVNPATLTDKPVLGQDFILQVSIFNDTTHNPSLGYHQYALGDTTITRFYKSSGGCDSLSTLKLFVCAPSFEHKDTVVCQDGTSRLDYGEFFARFKNGNKWPIADTVIYDTLRAKACMETPEFEEFKKHCPKFNGCDSVLELHLNVKKVVNNVYVENRCMSQGTIFEWREKESNRLIKTFSADTLNPDVPYTYSDIVKYVECTDCPKAGCDSVRNILRLTFVSDDQQSHTVHVCQGEKYTYSNSVNSSARTTFDSRGKLCNTPYSVTLTVQVRGTNESGQSVVMCEFDDVVTFFVDTVYNNQMTYDTVCLGGSGSSGPQTYSWEGHPKFSSIPVTRTGLFTYTDTLQTYDTDCDSICVLKLRVGQPYLVPTRKEICDDGSVRWQDTLFYGINYKGTIPTDGKSKQVTGDYYSSQRNMLSQYGCDSVLTFSLTIHPTYIAEQKDTAVCANEPYNFYGTWYNTASNPWTPGNTYPLEIHVNSIHGCDSMVLHNVTVYPTYMDLREEADTVCQEKGAYYTWANHPEWTGQQSIARVDSYELVDHLTTIHGCDSIWHKTLVVLPTYNLSFTHQMSSEDTVHWEGRIYAGTTAVFDNPNGWPVHTVSGINEITDVLHTKPIGTHTCDSVRTLTLKIGKVFRDTTYDATCANCGTYEWVITSPITGRDTIIYITDLPEPYEQRYYYDSLETNLGYDSIYVRVLTTYPNYNETEEDEVCQGETFIWNGHMAGDNGVQHRLYVDDQVISVIPTDAYGTVIVTDSMTTDTIFTDPKTGIVKPMHCDSVYVLTLTVHPTYNDRYVELTDLVSMSSNDTVSHFVQPHVLFVGYDFDFAAADITKAELELQYDTVVYIHSTGDEMWRDSVVNTSIFGCDSVHYVDIHICEMQFTQVYDTIADNDSTWFFGGDISNHEHTLPLVTGEQFHYYDDGTPVDYSQATGRTERQYMFIDTLRTANGCDSIVHTYLSVFPSYRFEFDTAVCANMTYNWRNHTNVNLLVSGPVYDSVGCVPVGTHVFDSVYVLGLTVLPAGYHHFDTTLCMNDTIIWHNQKVFYQPGGYNYVEAKYQGPDAPCGEIYHLDLTFVQSYGSEISVEYDTICQFDDYHWFTEGETTEHTANLRDGKGHKLDYIPTDMTGDFTFFDSLKTLTYCCDSVYTLKLHINPTYYTYDTTFVLCSSDTLRWQDTIYTYTGKQDVRDTIYRTSVEGCDSIHFMRLHFDLSYDTTETVFLCSDVEHYQWEDIVFDDTLRDANTWLEPRTYQFSRTYPTVLAGCDSTLRLDITIAPNFDSIWTDTICRGEIYNLFGQLLTEPGNYTAQQPNRWGCSTFYYLTLEEVPLTTFELDVEPVCVDQDGSANVYLLHYTFDGDAPISYSLRYDSAAHAEGFEDAEDVVIGKDELTLVLAVPSYTQPTDYPRPGVYQAQIAFNNGICLTDSLMTYDFDLEMNYPAWLTEQRYGDVIALLNESYNGGYLWSEYQWYQGDSLLVGQTKPYLHIPTGLIVGEQYHVMLTREGETEAYPTCPITVVRNPNDNDYMPTMGYLSVTPTCIVTANPVTHILSRKGGTYRIASSEGRLISEGSFAADVTPIQLPSVDGMYIIQLWSPETPEEPYRAIKVLVREKCENCATSF